jgi:sugar/nucleoside kinase (ribokinase family)
MMTLSGSPCRALFAGLATIDLLYVLDDLPRRNAKISVSGQQIAAGGPATNAAVTFASLGGSSTLLTAVGRHALAAVIREDLSRFSISLHDAAGDQTAPPPVSSILIVRDTGERTVVSANANAFPPLSPEISPQLFGGVSIILVDGHYMQLCLAVAQLARSRNIPVVLDSGSWKDGMEALLPCVDTAVCSDDFRPPGGRGDSDACEFLTQAGIARVAITRGAAPIRYCEHGASGEIPVEQVRARDTLGAGDIFHGAFCFATCEGRTFTDALKFAAQVASFSCCHIGTRAWIEKFRGTTHSPR